MTGIYTITSPTNKVYVGQSWNIEKRWKAYMGHSCRDQTKIYNSLKKYGWEAHKFDVVLELRDDISQDTLDCWEEYFYDLSKSQGCELLNIRLSGSRGKHSEESKKKMSTAQQKIKRVGEKHPMFGKERSPETKRKLSESHKGKKLSEETKLKLSKINKGKTYSDATKLKQSSTMKKIHATYSEEKKKERGINISLSKIGKSRPDMLGHKSHRFKGFIYAYKDGETIGKFEGLLSASKTTGVSLPVISTYLSGGHKKPTVRLGYTFIREPLQK
jgi:hypothetical protein